MPLLQRVVKPKTHRGKRFVENREPKLVENCKRAVFIRGVNANNVVLQAMKDFASFKRPLSVMYNKKNDIKPFEDAGTLEFFSQKNDSALFMFGSHNKKRPNNIVIGRTFDHQILDMVEFGIENYKALSEFKNRKIPVGTKPLLMFIGEVFENQHDYQRIKNLLIDFFRGPVVEFVSLKGFEHLFVFAECQGKILLRSYRTMLKKSTGKVPAIELEEIGPHMDLTLRRTRLASNDLFKQACKKPFQLKPKKVKNISKDALGTTHGRIHMQSQDYNQLETWKIKGLKRKNKLTENGDSNKRLRITSEPSQEQDSEQTVL